MSGQQPIRPPTGPAGAAPAAPFVPLQPSWFPLDEAHEKWVNEILAYWEKQSSQVKIFECKFDRFDYDPINGPKTEAKNIAQGVIKYAQPDKGLYRVERLLSYAGPPKNPGEQAQYVEEDAAFGEHWVCDGKQIHAFEAPKKQVWVSLLPPELQGTAIVDGPLPFMFGAKAQTIKARYWIHGLEGGPEGKFLLEAVPKGRQDVQNFKTIHILLDGKTFLPESLILFAPNYDPKTNASKTTLIFKEIKTDKTLLDKFPGIVDPWRIFTSEFYNVKIPAGWTKVVDRGGPIPAGPTLEAKGLPDGPKGRGFLPLPR